jgi:hypothetical protein
MTSVGAGCHLLPGFCAVAAKLAQEPMPLVLVVAIQVAMVVIETLL